MSDRNPSNPTSDPQPDGVAPVELLVGRVIDGEASREEFARFAQLAARDGSVWHVYTEGRGHQELLHRAVAEEIEAACRVNLPRRPAISHVVGVIRASHGYLAWAALVALALVLGLSDRSPGVPSVRVVDRSAVEPGPVISSDEFDPVLLHTQPLPDGRVRVTWMRRILEVLDLDDFDPALDARPLSGAELVPPTPPRH